MLTLTVKVLPTQFSPFVVSTAGIKQRNEWLCKTQCCWLESWQITCGVKVGCVLRRCSWCAHSGTSHICISIQTSFDLCLWNRSIEKAMVLFSNIRCCRRSPSEEQATSLSKTKVLACLRGHNVRNGTYSTKGDIYSAMVSEAVC